ncbi:MAG: hypothetical protein HC896_15300 [Bacteroidales bacterium]|nr:hypothetical protein [Bacteroidales bacterium]
MFWGKMTDLGYDICHVLGPIQENAGGMAMETPKTKTVFLAHTTNDQLNNREIIKRELLLRNIAVRPNVNLPQTETAQQKILKQP